MSVRTRLLVSFGILALFMAIAGGMAAYQQLQLTRAAAIQEAEHVASTIASTLALNRPGTAPAPMPNDAAFLHAYAASLGDRGRRNVAIVDPSLRIIASSDPNETGKMVADPEVGETLRDGAAAAFVAKDAGSPGGRRKVVVPIRDAGGQILGAVMLGYTRAYERGLAGAWRTIENLEAITLLMLLAALALWYEVSRGIITPLRRLRDGLARLAKGETAVRIDPQSRGELGALVDDFNTMAFNLRLSQADLIAAREHARNLLKSAGEGFVGLDRHGWVTFVNPMAAKMLGYDEEDLLGQRWHEFVHQTKPGGTSSPWEGSPVAITLEQGTLQQATDVFWRKDATSFPAEYVVTTIRRGVEVVGAVVTFRDITERLRTEEALARQTEALVRSNEDANQRRKELLLLNQMGDLLQSCATLDEAYAIFRSMIGRLFPKEAGAVYVIGAAQDVVHAVATWGPAAARNGAFTPDACWALRRGRVHFVEDTSVGLVCKHLPSPPPLATICAPLVAQGEALGILYLASEGGTADGFSEAKQALAEAVAEPLAQALANLRLRETLRNQSIRDPLTGLFNRRYLEETLERELRRAERIGHTVGVIMLDIDLFKQFNDTFGHDAGDAVLGAIGAVLEQRIRKEDIGCRYGGEEFLIVLPDASLDDTLARADELQAAVRALNVVHRGRPLGSVTLSMGVAAFPKHGTATETLMRAVDGALYRAKQGGRARVAVA